MCMLLWYPIQLDPNQLLGNQVTFFAKLQLVTVKNQLELNFNVNSLFIAYHKLLMLVVANVHIPDVRQYTHTYVYWAEEVGTQYIATKRKIS